MAGDDREQAAENLPKLERRSRLLLRAYPAAYRRGRGEEIIGTLLEATPRDRSWPLSRDARALVTGGLRARADHNRHLTTADNLRIAVMVGVALYLSVWIGIYLRTAAFESGPHSMPGLDWPGVLIGLPVAATVVLAWTAPRSVVLAGALPAAGAICYFMLVRTHFPHYVAAAFIGPAVTQLASLAGLVVLRPRTARPSSRWLWLVGVVGATALPPSLYPYLTSSTLIGAIGVISIAWIGIDARLPLAFMTYFTLTMLQLAAVGIVGPGLLPLCIFVAIAALAVWLLRRQSARTKTAG
jgi:hypothetical protein